MTSYICLTRSYGEMPLCCRIKQIKKNTNTEQLLFRQPIFLEIVTEVELIKLNILINETET